ncbi:MAG TPA: ribosome small subunit-dependent GTPase A [Ruminiclostridium sp.]
MSIKDFGWDEYFEREWNQRYTDNIPLGPVVSYTQGLTMQPGRIIADYGQMIRVTTDTEELLVSRPVKKLDKDIQLSVGDWVALEHTVESICVRDVLTRKTKFSRAAAGPEVKEQIVAANIDTVFLIQSLNRDFNMKRLERYLIATWESGAIPVIVLTKTDCCDDVDKKIDDVYRTAPGVKVHAISCVTGEGIEEIRKYFVQGKTVALLGSSGVGKSTLLNTLAGEELLKTQTVREDDSRGRHTTTHRELLLLKTGGLVLDTPGMRALSLWEADAGMEIMFGGAPRKRLRYSRWKSCAERVSRPPLSIPWNRKGDLRFKRRTESW